MKIYITLDYEIYFGENHGTVEKCMIYPTSQLIEIGEKHNVNFVFFVDCGFILKLNEYKKKYPQLENDYKLITDQVKELSDKGHDVQLHIHPHWEDSSYNGERWIINVNRYKLSDFSEDEILDIVKRYKRVIADITGKKIFAFRAGGWCLQPFSKLYNAFKKENITLDSSVFRNGYFNSQQYSYDFRDAPDKDMYRFEKDVVSEEKHGVFTELPISSIKNSPLFFWKLFFLGRKDPYMHKPLGDGRAMVAPGYRKKLLTQFTNNPVSVDGYNSHLLNRSLKNLIKEKKGNMVVIGHPKALSRYSLVMIEKFIADNKSTHRFTTFEKEFLK
jgi:peptidoglycan/xylan/chitin deacetylase (PgdA/CDA1 family)